MHNNLSVIIVTCNNEKIIGKALDSLKQQDVEHELIVVDNNSKDNSVSILEKYKPKLIENTKNNGFAQANNLALRQAKGDFILLMNPDIILEKNTIKELIAFMEKNKNIGIASPMLLNKDMTLQHSCRRFPTRFSLLCKNTFLKHLFPGVAARYLMKDYGHKNPINVDWVSGALMLIRKEALDKAGLLDEDFFMYLEDVDICRRIGKYYDVMYYPKAKAIHLGGYASKRKLNALLIHLKSAVHYFKKEKEGKYD